MIETSSTYSSGRFKSENLDKNSTLKKSLTWDKTQIKKALENEDFQHFDLTTQGGLLGLKGRKMMKKIEGELIRRYGIELKKRKGLKYQILRLLRKVSVYSLPNGIFHENEIQYESNTSYFAKSLLLLMTTTYTFYKGL